MHTTRACVLVGVAQKCETGELRGEGNPEKKHLQQRKRANVVSVSNKHIDIKEWV